MAKSDGKTKISTEISKEDLDLVKILAEKSDISVSEWLRNAIALAIPKDLRARVMPDMATQAMEALVEAQDAQPEEMFPTLPLPPMALALTEAAFGRPLTADPYADVVKERVKLEVLDQKTHANDTTSPHACIYLSKEANSFFRASECEGTCKAPSQPGRVCFWPSASARNCPVYQPRREHIR